VGCGYGPNGHCDLSTGKDSKGGLCGSSWMCRRFEIAMSAQVVLGETRSVIREKIL
jgi:hypothetical protein